MAAPAAPVALSVFNRPDLTARVFEVIRAAKPPVLFISADGPRPDRPDDDARLCRETLDVVQGVDWPCDVHWKLREQNLGCGPAMSQGISWVFEQVDRAIILEDDCVPYRDDSRVLQIAGSNLNPPAAAFAGASDSFASFRLVWGWATWRRARTHDFETGSWPAFRDSSMLAGLHACPQRRPATPRVEPHPCGERHVGPPVAVHRHERARAFHLPSTNLISNLGFRADAT